MFTKEILAITSLAALAVGECTRATLQELTAGYLKSLASGTAAVPGLAESVEYEENDVAMAIGSGILSSAVTIAFNRTLYDTTLCASYTEIVSTTPKAYVIGTRLALDEAGTAVGRIESVVCDDGDWLFNVAGSLRYNQQEAWDPIPEAQRDSREVLKAAGDAYINAWGDSSISPPFATPCARLEGGAYLQGNCKLTFPPPFNVTNRRYTIDEEIGAVDIFHNFPFLDSGLPRDPGTQTNNLMRVEGGKIRYIHENTVCSGKRGCR